MKFKMNLILILSLTGLFCLQRVEACRPSIQEYFPEAGVARAFVIMKGQFNGSQIKGYLKFTQNGVNEAVMISGNITGLPKISKPTKHGLHVHEYTPIEEDGQKMLCGTCGGHFNPTKSTHGDISFKIRHVGDLGNVFADDGVINIGIVDNMIKLYGKYGIIGRTLVLHHLEDDLGLADNEESKKTGNAGKRIACGIIGIIG